MTKTDSLPFRSSPFMTWAKTCAAAELNLANSGIAAYTLEEQQELGIDLNALAINGINPYGLEEVKDQLAAIYRIDPQEILITSSVSMANFLVMSLLLDSGDEVMIEAPTYEPFLSNAKFLNAETVRFDRKRSRNFQPDPEEVLLKITDKTKLMILTSPNNPSGISIEHKILQRLKNAASEKGITILMDEIFGDINPDNDGMKRSPTKNFISVNGLSKSYGFGGLRFGWVIADKEVIARLRLLQDLIGITNPYIVDKIALQILNNRDKVLARTRRIAERNHQALAGFLKQCEGRIEAVVEPWSIIAFPKFTAEFKNVCKDSEYLLSLARGAATHPCLSFAPGDFFGEKHAFRLGFGGKAVAVQSGLDELAKLINGL